MPDNARLVKLDGLLLDDFLVILGADGAFGTGQQSGFAQFGVDLGFEFWVG